MTVILRTSFGSRLYGTANENSDFDIKTIFIPDAKDIIFQKANNISNEKIDALDKENIPLLRYVNFVTTGQTNALDILFSPPEAWLESPSPVWFDILNNKEKLITKKSTAIISYCLSQTNKYAVKGDRVKTVRETYDFLLNLMKESRNPQTDKLGIFENELRDFCSNKEKIKIVSILSNNKPIDHLEVCGKRMAFTGKLRTACSLMQSMLNEYGERTLRAEQQDERDWKAMSHAIRIAQEAIELFTTGKITFPLINADYIRSVKEGKVDFWPTADYIDSLLLDVEYAVSNTNLREEPDMKWVEDFIMNVYSKEVLKHEAK